MMNDHLVDREQLIDEANRKTEERNGWGEWVEWVDETYQGIPI